MIAVKAVLWA